VRPAGRSRKSPAKGKGIGRKRKEAAQDETTRRINLPSVHLASLQLLGSGLHWEKKKNLINLCYVCFSLLQTFKYIFIYIIL